MTVTILAISTIAAALGIGVFTFYRTQKKLEKADIDGEEMKVLAEQDARPAE